MPITKHDAILLMYNLGGMFSTGHLVWQVEVTNRIELILIALAIAVVWTIYSRIVIIDRITDYPRFVEEKDESAHSSDT